MSKLENKLNDRQLKAWLKAGKPIAGKSDGGGLTFTLSKAGTASWVFRYRIAGRPRELTLGNYPDNSLLAARKLANKARVDVDALKDVAGEKRAMKAEAKQAKTVDELAMAFINQAIRPKYKYPERVESVFRRDILPKLGAQPASAILPADVDRVLRAILADSRPTVANDALRLMRAMFAYGRKRGLVDQNPAADFDLDDAGGSEGKRNRKLAREEISKLFLAMGGSRASFGRDNELAVFLLLALGVRKMELLAARWDEIDLDNGVWTLPAGRTKTQKAIAVPLAAPVREWLQELKVRACDSPYVLPSRRAPSRFPHVGPDTLNVALKDLAHGLPHFTIHDFRRTMRTQLAMLGISSEIAERCLNHALRGIEATYNQHDYFEERKHAMGLWANLLKKLIVGGQPNAMPLRKSG